MEVIQVTVSVRLDLEQMQRVLTPQEVQAVMAGVAQVLNAQRITWK